MRVGIYSFIFLCFLVRIGFLGALIGFLLSDIWGLGVVEVCGFFFGFY